MEKESYKKRYGIKVNERIESSMRDIVKIRYIIFPVNQNFHWYLLIFDIFCSKVWKIDSLSSSFYEIDSKFIHIMQLKLLN